MMQPEETERRLSYDEGTADIVFEMGGFWVFGDNEDGVRIEMYAPYAMIQSVNIVTGKIAYINHNGMVTPITLDEGGVLAQIHSLWSCNELDKLKILLDSRKEKKN